MSAELLRRAADEINTWTPGTAQPTATLLRVIATRAAELSPASGGFVEANILGYREAVTLAREILGEPLTVTATVPYVAPHGGRIEAGETFEVREVTA